MVGVLRPSPNPLPEGEGFYWFQGSPFQSLLSPKNDPSEKVQGLGLVHRLLFNRLRFRILDGFGHRPPLQLHQLCGSFQRLYDLRVINLLMFVYRPAFAGQH